MFNIINKLFTFSQNALKICEKRQEILASNIANADTPNYKSMDINFAYELDKLSKSQHIKNLEKPFQKTFHHQSCNQNTIPSSITLIPVTPFEIKSNGNTVDMNRERIEFINNSLKYEANIVFINNEIKNITHVLKG